MSIDMATSRPQKLAYNNQVGLFRLHTLLTDGGNLVVRRIFIHKLQSQNISLTDCLTEESEVILNLIKTNKIHHLQLGLLFPDDGHDPTIESFDLMLAIELLQNLRIFCLKSYFERKPSPNDLSVEADLARLKEYRNRFSYASGLGGIDEEDFNIKWADIVAILQRLNSSLPEPDSGLQKIINDDIVGKLRLEQGENNEQSENVNTDTDGSTLLSKLENKRYRPPKTACIFDGRLLKLNKKDIHGLEENCSFYVGRGSFGEVYASESKLDGFGLRVAYKKIPHYGPYEKSIRREKIASRIMHPFILPLLAVEDRPKGRQEVWFISPYCENGDLNYAIEIDHDASSRECMKMNNVTRVKILLQIALAIEYIHTSVKNVREAILHKDIASKNIVLDAHYNARLIDFGLAKEKDDETTTNLSGRLPYLTPEMKTGMANATESSDYYSFGVVIREMLTGLKPKLDKADGGGFLSCMDAETILTKLQQYVWLEEAPVTARRLNSIAQICLEAEKWDVSVFKTEVVKDLRDILTEYNGKILDIPEDYKRCHICMINPQATESSMTQKHEITCILEIKVCVACEKNSFLNPITCYCGAKLKPDIGYRWGALLVAGNDEKGANLAEAMANDVEEMKKVITSRAPRIMGIPENNVCIVVPEQPKDKAKTEKLVSKVEEKIRYFRTNTDVETLLIYLSCHGQRKDENGKSGFQFGSASDFMSHDDFERALEELTNINRLIVVLDCCYPPLIKLSKPTIQINSCRSDETALSLHDNGMFTKYLIQGLKAESEKTCLDNCEHCKAYWGQRSDFISLENLFDYVNNHLNGKAPPPDWQQRSWKNIAFFSDEKVEIEFTFNDDDKKKQHVHVPLGYLQNMHELKETLREKFGKDEKVTVSIQKDTFRKDVQFIDCDTLEKVMSAWVHRQPLHVTFGESTNQS